MDIIIRTATVDDVAAVAVLFNHYRQFYQQAADLSLAHRFIQDRLQQQQSVILVAETSAKTLVGFCQLYPTFCSVAAQPIYVLYDLFVSVAARQSGIGQQLLQAAEAQAKQDGKARLDLSTAKDNHTAQRLYERHGWQRDEIFLTYSRSL